MLNKTIILMLLVFPPLLTNGPFIYSMSAPLEANSVSASTHSVWLNWSGTGTNYRVYRDNKVVYEGKESRYADLNLNPGYTYSYRIDALNESQAIIGSIKIQIGTDKPGRDPQRNLNDLLMTTIVNKGEVKMDWEDIEGVSEYSIFKNNMFVKTVKASEFTDYMRIPGRTSTFHIVAKRKADQSAIDSINRSVAERHIELSEKQKKSLYDEEIDIEKEIGDSRFHEARAITAPKPDRRWSFIYTTFLADKWVRNPNLFSEYAWFRGDDRGYAADSNAYRTKANVAVCFCSAGQSVELIRLVGTTRVYNKNKQFLEKKSASANGIELYPIDTDSESRIAFRLKHAVGNPFASGMDIDYEVNAEFYSNGIYKLSGVHDGAPHHEIYLSEDGGASMETVHQAASKGLLWLAPVMPQTSWSKSNF